MFVHGPGDDAFRAGRFQGGLRDPAIERAFPDDIVRAGKRVFQILASRCGHRVVFDQTEQRFDSEDAKDADAKMVTPQVATQTDTAVAASYPSGNRWAGVSSYSSSEM